MADNDYDAILRLLMDRHPESRALLFELDELVGRRLVEEERRALDGCAWQRHW